MQRLWIQSVLAFLCCLIVFSFMLGSRPLNNPDETRYSSVSVEMVNTHDYVTPRVNGIKFLDKPILFYWLQAASIYVFGLHNTSLRLVSALFACLGSVAIFLLATAIYDRKTAWLTLLMLISSPMYFVSAHYINMDMMIAALITSCLCCFYGASTVGKKEQRRILLYGCYIFAALGFLTKGLIGFVLPGLIILVWMIWQQQWSILKWIFSPIGIILFLLITLPWYVAVQQSNPDFFHYFFIFEQFERFSQSGFNNGMPWWFYLPITLVFLLPWSSLIIPSMMYGFKYGSVKHQPFLITWVIVVFVFFSIPQSKIISYILPVFPPLALLFSGYVSVISKNNRYVSALSFINFLAYFIVTLVLLFSLNWYHCFELFIAQKTYFYAIIGLMALTTLISFSLYLKRKWLIQLILTSISTILLFWLLMLAVQWPQLTVEPIAKKLQTFIKPTDKLVVFETYPYALRLYVNHPIIVVTEWNWVTLQDDNWKGHFWYSATQQQKQQLLLTQKQFWQLWHGPQKVYVIMETSTYQKLQNKKFNLKQIVMSDSEEILLVNH